MKNINWNNYYKLHTIKERRDYLQTVFGDWEKGINKKLFVIDPVKSKGDLKLSKRLTNLAKDTLRHIILPFPVTWSHKNTDPLVKKSVVSMEEYAMGSKGRKPLESPHAKRAFRYRSLLIEFVFPFMGTIVGLSMGTMGVAPAVAIGVAGIGLACYVGYAAWRASRKAKIQETVVRSRIENQPRDNKVELLYERTYGLLSTLEEEQKNAQGSSDSPKSVRNKILSALKMELSPAIHTNKSQTEHLARLLKRPIETFIANTESESLTNAQLQQQLDTLIHSLESMDIYAQYEKFNTHALVDSLITKFSKGNPNDRRANILKHLKMHDMDQAGQGGMYWTREQYIQKIQQSDQIKPEDKALLVDQMGGAPIINFTQVLNNDELKSLRQKYKIPPHILNMEVIISPEKPTKTPGTGKKGKGSNRG